LRELALDVTQAISPNGAQSVYLALRRRFADGDLGPNERLAETALAQELGVSRTPVREALGRLLADGLVVPGQPRQRLKPAFFAGIAVLIRARPRSVPGAVRAAGAV
jgi:DNA-binding transcriptional MocR family regulator